MCQLAVLNSLGSVSLTHVFTVFPGPFKSSSESPQRTVPNIPRNVPSYQYQSSPLKAVPYRAGGLGGQAEQGVEIVIFIPNSFLG